MPQLT